MVGLLIALGLLSPEALGGAAIWELGGWIAKGIAITFKIFASDPPQSDVDKVTIAGPPKPNPPTPSGTPPEIAALNSFINLGGQLIECLCCLISTKQRIEYLLSVPYGTNPTYQKDMAAQLKALSDNLSSEVALLQDFPDRPAMFEPHC